MEKINKPSKPENVPYIVFESEMARQERISKRLWIALLTAIVACVLIVVGFLMYLNQYDFVSYDYAQDGKGVNIIGDWNGVDYDGPAAENPSTEEEIRIEG